MADNRSRCNTWVADAGFCFLTLNSGLAIYRAKGDLSSILFVSVSYLALVLLLFAYIRAYERAPPGSPAMDRARHAVWPLTTGLTLAVAWKVAAVMPWAVTAAVVWGLAATTTTSGGFFAMFLFVSVSYLALVLLLFAYIRAYERAPPGSPAMDRARRTVWPRTTGLTLAFAWKVAAVMPWAVTTAVVWGLAAATTAGGFLALFLLVTVFYVALVLLFACLRAYERAPPGSPASERARRAVRALTTLLTWNVTAFLPWAVPAAAVWGPAIATAGSGFFALFLFVTVFYVALVLLFACLRAYERAPPGSPANERVAALKMAALGAMACDAALAIHEALGGMGSATLVLLAYAALLALTFRFLRAFAGRARGQEQGAGVGANDAAHGHVHVEAAGA